MASNDTPAPSTVPDVPAGPAGFAGFLTRNLTTIVLVVLGAALLGYFLKGASDPVEMLFSIIKVVVGLGLVVFIHELGHFVAAKWCDVYVQTFSIGFGGPFLGFCSAKWGETTYKIGWIPLGGYVKMMGEGEENEENAEDPRSYKNKKVWQRMIIISAGVVMNMILAFVIYLVVFSMHGEELAPGVIGVAQPGGPGWKKGFRPGTKIVRIGDLQDPHFEEMKRKVFKTGRDRDVDMTIETYTNGRPMRHEVQVRPIRKGAVLAPMLLVGGSRVPQLIHKGSDDSPTIPDSAASRAEPKFQFGDRIIAATDPENPAAVTPLREDPRRPGTGTLDYYDLDRRMQFLLDKPITLRIARDGVPSPIDIRVEPQYARTIGLRMMMGPIVALRDDSPAAKAGVQAREDKDGDILEAVEVTAPDGTKRRWSAAPKEGERPLDPMRLPTDLALWAASKPKDYTVQVTVSRFEAHQRVNKTLTMTWDAEWDLIERSQIPIPDVPVSIGALGLAYAVQSTIAAVEPDSPAADRDLKPGDKIASVAIRVDLPTGDSHTDKEDVKDDGWALYGMAIQSNPQVADVELKLSDGRKVNIKPAVDRTLPLLPRGLEFMELKILRQPQDPADLLQMTGRRMLFETTRIYENISGLIGGRLSPKAISGPITIAKHSFDLAGHDTWEFLIFLAMININLAVVNFLPIPVLDGGHMVFLGYEALRGKPPSERWRFILTIIGLVVVLGLMLFGLALDFGRHLLDPLRRLLGL